MIGLHASVLINDATPIAKDISLKEIVPGDILKLAAGDMIPADCRFLECNDLFISEAVLTGESIPVNKIPTLVDGNAKELSGFINLGWMGTNVVSGTAIAVWRTAAHTYLGSIAKKLNNRRAPTGFETGINKLSWLDALLFGLSVAVGLTPEMLPMIVTSTLAKGAMQMAQKKVIVKRLDSIQNIGAMNILCTDKTGTLIGPEMEALDDAALFARLTNTTIISATLFQCWVQARCCHFYQCCRLIY